MNLNCVGPLTHGIFSNSKYDSTGCYSKYVICNIVNIVNMYYFSNSKYDMTWLIEAEDMEPKI